MDDDLAAEVLGNWNWTLEMFGEVKELAVTFCFVLAAGVTSIIGRGSPGKLDPQASKQLLIASQRLPLTASIVCSDYSSLAACRSKLLRFLVVELWGEYYYYCDLSNPPRLQDTCSE